MEIFFQHEGESVIINGDISVKVIEINGDEVVLEIDAPEWMEIDEYEPSCLEDKLEERWLLQPR